MAQTGLSPFMKGLIMTCLFTFFILLFIVQFLNVTNPSSSVLSSQYGLANGSNSMQNILNNYTNTANSVQHQIATASLINPVSIFLIFKAAFDIPQLFINLIATTIATVSGILFPGMAGPFALIFTTVLAVIGTVLLIEAVFLIVKAIRTGESFRVFIISPIVGLILFKIIMGT